MYTEFGTAYRQLAYAMVEAEADNRLVGYGNPAAAWTYEQAIQDLSSYTKTGIISEADIRRLESFRAFVSSGAINETMLTRDMVKKVNQWMVTEGITLESSPILYHAFQASKSALFDTQTALLKNKGKGVAHGEDDNFSKMNDGQYCIISGTFCTVRTQGGRLAGLVRGGVAAGVAGIFRETADWSSEQEIIGIINLGNLAETVTGAAIAGIVSTFWDEIFCSTECDNCGPAIGINAVFENCQFIGIRLIGNFEFADRFELVFDTDFDGAFDETRSIREPSSPFIPAAQLPPGNLNIAVDIVCDGAQAFPWPGGSNGVFVDRDNFTPVRPTANFTQPALESGYFYRPYTPLQFTTFAVATQGWNFNNWAASGATPATGNSLFIFTTQFNQDIPLPRNVGLVFSHPCETNAYTVSGPSFLICPTGSCP
jgi:hypothetical protein